VEFLLYVKKHLASKKWHRHISKYLKLQAYLKRQCDTYKPKKSKVLSKSEIDKFFTEAPDDTYLMIKVNYFVAFIFQ
jgi:hypothetical protein